MVNSALLRHILGRRCHKETKKSDAHWSGRTQHSLVTVFPKGNYKIGDFVNVQVIDCTSATLIGEAIGYSENN